MKRASDNCDATMRVSYHFSHTDAWEQLTHEAGRDRLTTPSEIQRILVLDELRLLGLAKYETARLEGLSRALATRESIRHGLSISSDVVRREGAMFRAAHGLESADAFAAWIADQGLSEESFETLVEREARLGWVRALFQPELDDGTLDYLKVAGNWRETGLRAIRKQAILANTGYEDTAIGANGLTQRELFRWYFGEVLGSGIPADLNAYARRLELDDATEFARIIAREYFYRMHLDRAALQLK
jgi:hypothetical protein